MRAIVRSLLPALILVLAATSPVSATDWTVNIVSFQFDPREVNGSTLERVIWTNRESTIHTTTSDIGLWDSGNLGLGESFTFRFVAPGTYNYFCSIHSFRGTIRIAALQPPPPTTPPPATTEPPATPTPTPTASPSPPSPTPPPTPTRTPAPTPSATAPTPTPRGSPPASPAAQANTFIGVVLVLIGLAILGAAFWWRFRPG